MYSDPPHIVNRCQTEVQKSLGTPAQADKVDNLSKELAATDRRIESLDKRIDVVQMVASLLCDSIPC